MIVFEPSAHVTMFSYAGTKEFVAGLFEGPVDVVNRDNMKPHVRRTKTPFMHSDKEARGA